MAEPEKKHECPNCERLERRATELEARVADLEGKLAKAQKNSATSSKPPSSDIVKPPPKRGNGKRGKLASTHARNWQVYRRPDRLRHLYQGRYKSFPIEGEKGNRMTKDRWERLRLVFVGACIGVIL